MPRAGNIEHRHGAGCSGRLHPDERIAELAAHQHGVVARRQLLEEKLSRREIGRRLESGHLHAIHSGIYAVGHARLTAPGRLIAAALAGGPGAVVSHRSAAGVWAVRPDARSTVDVTTAGKRRHRQRVCMHRGHLEEIDRDVLDGVPVTSLSRTLLDLAAVVRDNDLSRAIERADRLELLDAIAIEELIRRSRSSGHRPAA